MISSRFFEYPTNSCARYGEENLQITVINIELIPTVYPKYIATKINCAYMSTPYVTTPFFPRYFNSCRLNSIDPKEEEIFVMNSEAPLDATCMTGDASSFVGIIFNSELFFFYEVNDWKNPPILCEIPVASVAPVIPSGNTAIRIKSIDRQDICT